MHQPSTVRERVVGFFAPWRLGVLALNAKAPRRKGAEGKARAHRREPRALAQWALPPHPSPNKAAPAKPAGAFLFDSQPVDRGLAEPSCRTQPPVTGEMQLYQVFV